MLLAVAGLQQLSLPNPRRELRGLLSDSRLATSHRSAAGLCGKAPCVLVCMQGSPDSDHLVGFVTTLVDRFAR